MTVSNLSSVGFDRLAAAYSEKPGTVGTSALKGSIKIQKMIQNNLSEMMRDITPKLGQNIDVEA